MDGVVVSAAFTPGPWQVWIAPDGAAVVKRIYQDERGRVTEWPAVCNCAGLPNEANARLIAAAPKLYAVLQSIVTNGLRANRQAAIDVLAKARGASL